MSRFFDLLVANEIYADIDFIMSPTTDGKTENFYLAGTLTSLTVDWGDGTTTTASTTNSHTYTSAGDYRVRVLGDCRAVTRFAITNTYSTSIYYDITEVNNVNLPNATNAGYMFFYCNRLRRIGRINIHNATNIRMAFTKCTSLTSLPDGFRCTSCSDAYYVFNTCSALTDLPSGFTLPNCTSVAEMFSYCYNLTNLPSGFTFSPSATNYRGVFLQCGRLTSLPDGIVSNLQYVTNFRQAFLYCKSLVWTPQASVFWERVSPQVQYNGQTFQGCTSLTNYASIPTAWKDGGTTTLYQPPNS